MNDLQTGDVAALERDVVDNAASYSFDQLVRLLRGRLQGDEEVRGTNGASLRIRPSLARDLPGAEVASVEPRDGAYDIVTTFLGLYGASSPLPAFYTEELIEAAQEDRTAAQALLDLVHQHLFELYVEVRENQRVLDAAVERGDERFTDALRSLVGLIDPQVRRTLQEPDRMLRYVALLAPRQSSAEGLRTLLADALGDTPVTVEQCVERRVRIPAASRLRLGQQGNALGESAVLGVHVRDRIGRFRIRIGPLSDERFHDLVNRSNHWEWLVGLIRLYLKAPTQCELDVMLEEGAGATTVLGQPELSQLGTTTWLFSGEPEGIRANLQLD